MLEEIFIFIMQCFWGFIYVGFLLGALVLAVWLVSLAIRIISGKDDSDCRFPFRW